MWSQFQVSVLYGIYISFPFAYLFRAVLPQSIVADAQNKAEHLKKAEKTYSHTHSRSDSLNTNLLWPSKFKWFSESAFLSVFLSLFYFSSASFICEHSNCIRCKYWKLLSLKVEEVETTIKAIKWRTTVELREKWSLFLLLLALLKKLRYPILNLNEVNREKQKGPTRFLVNEFFTDDILVIFALNTLYYVWVWVLCSGVLCWQLIRKNMLIMMNKKNLSYTYRETHTITQRVKSVWADHFCKYEREFCRYGTFHL